jgi:hypothetical protein
VIGPHGAFWAEEHAQPSGDWRRDLTAIARSQRRTLLRHPWLSAELTAHPSFGPNLLHRSDAALAAAAALTPDATPAGEVVATALAYVRGAVSAEIAEEQARRRTGLTKEQWQHSVGPCIRGVVAGGEYPHLARSIVEGDDPADDERFEFGLACVLDGLAARAAGSAWTAARRLDR